MEVASRGYSRKTIVKLINKKIDHWLKNIDKKWTDENGSEDEKKSFLNDIRNHYIVTGGAIVNMLQGIPPNDYDIYFDNPEVCKKVVDFYLSKLSKTDRVSKIEGRITEDSKGNKHVGIFVKSAGVAQENENLDDYTYFENLGSSSIDQYFDKEQFFSKQEYSTHLITTNAISLNNDIQIITRFVGDPAEIHKNFDFVHCTNYYSVKTGLVLNPSALEAILCKRLYYVGSVYPICSLFRLRKFIKRGWSITAAEIFKMAWDTNKLDLNDISVLEDQLTGCDSAYFQEVLSILKSDKDSFFFNKERSDRSQLDRTYLFNLLDKVFSEDGDDFISPQIINDLEL